MFREQGYGASRFQAIPGTASRTAPRRTGERCRPQRSNSNNAFSGVGYRFSASGGTTRCLRAGIEGPDPCHSSLPIVKKQVHP